MGKCSVLGTLRRPNTSFIHRRKADDVVFARRKSNWSYMWGFTPPSPSQTARGNPPALSPSSVPPRKPQPVVALRGLVVLVVMRRRGEPPAQPVAGKAARHGLYGQVPMGVAHDLVDGEGKQHQAVQRRHQQRQWRDQAVDQCLDGVKGIRRPWRRVA